MSRVRIGVIGAGWFATTNHIPVLARRPDVELAAVCRPGREPLLAIQDTFGFRFATEDYRELLEQDLDGVIVSSPHDLHYEHASAALRQGLHIVCEKPMALEPTQAWDHHANERGKLRVVVVNAREPFEAQIIFFACCVPIPGLQQAHQECREVCPVASLDFFMLEIALQVAMVAN